MSEMINSIDDTCDGCKYNRENQEGNCSRFVKFVDGKEKICGDKIQSEIVMIMLVN